MPSPETLAQTIRDVAQELMNSTEGYDPNVKQTLRAVDALREAAGEIDSLLALLAERERELLDLRAQLVSGAARENDDLWAADRVQTERAERAEAERDAALEKLADCERRHA